MKLKSCPFCGGDTTEIFHSHYQYRVECRSCGGTLGTQSDPSKAAHAWNSRPGEQAARVEALEEVRRAIVEEKASAHTSIERGHNVDIARADGFVTAKLIFSGTIDKLIKATNAD